MLVITKTIPFVAGHRLPGVEPCNNPHGHNYRVEVTFEADDDQANMVVDFSVVGKVLKQWINANWDHAFLYDVDDPMANVFAAHGYRFYKMPEPPTAEAMAREFYRVTKDLVPGARMTAVTIYETETCSATYLPDQ